MEKNRLESELIEHCAPTLAGIKSAGLFSYFYSDAGVAKEELKEVNHLLNGKGVCVEALLWREKSVLIYTYRTGHLQRELEGPGAEELLAEYGYKNCDVTECIGHLKERLNQDTCFLHEIGIFLGYPLEDVKGFIENGGRNCKCCGFWKVYCNEAEKVKVFEKLKKCSQIYLRLFSEGRSIRQMTVCT